MKKISLLVLVVMLLAVALTACGNNEPPVDTHVHTYTDEWSTDATSHWHAATCDGHSSEKVSVAPHVDADNDAVCDVCGTTEFDADHTHVAKDTWSYNADAHWHDAACGHGMIFDSADHTPDEAGVCTVCGYGVDNITVGDAVELGVANKDLVVDGIAFIEKDDALGYVDEQLVSYVHGDGFIKVDDGDYVKWYSLYNGSCFAVEQYYYVDEEGNVVYEDASRNTYVTTDNLDGFQYYVLGYSLSVYGTENLVSQLYAMAEENLNADAYTYVTTEDGVTAYCFGFGYFDGSAFYEVAVSFSLSENYSYENVYVEVDKYSYIWSEPDYYYGYDSYTDEEGNEYYYATWLIPNGKTVITVAQNEGERTLENEYPAEELVPTSIALVDGEGNQLTDAVVNVVVGSQNYYTLSLLAPETANMAFAGEFIATVYINGSEAMEWSDYRINMWNGNIYLTFLKGGEFEVTISGDASTVTYNFNATVPAPTQLNPSVNGETTDSATVYNGSTAIIGATDVNEYADSSFTAAITSENAADAALTTEGGVVSFTSLVNGEYVITITSTVDSTVVATITITVVDAPDVSDILVGKYQGNYYDYSFELEFIPSEEGAVNGTVNVTVNAPNPAGWWMGTITTVGVYSYEYSVDNGIVVTYVSGDEVAFALSLSSLAEVVFTYEGSDVTLTKVTLAVALASVYSWNSEETYTDSFGDTIPKYQLSFNEYGASMFDASIGTYGDYFDFEFVVDDNGNITFNWLEDVDAKYQGMTAVYADDVVTVTYSDGTTGVFTASQW